MVRELRTEGPRLLSVTRHVMNGANPHTLSLDNLPLVPYDQGSEGGSMHIGSRFTQVGDEELGTLNLTSGRKKCCVAEAGPRGHA